MNTKEKLIENLRKETFKEAKLERKNKQFVIAMKALLVLYLTFCIVAVLVLPHQKILLVISEVSAWSVVLAIVILFFSKIFLPFGETSKERIDEKFQKLVNTRMKNKSEHAGKIKSELLELEQELEILKEL